MGRLFQNGTVYIKGKFEEKDFIIDDDGCIVTADKIDVDDVEEIIDCAGLHIFPGFIDPHVHLREPGYSYKETMSAGTKAAAHGGYTTVFAMPNINPVPDSVENIKQLEQHIEQNACIHVLPIASITKGQKGVGELVDFDQLIKHTYLFSDDGKGVQEDDMMKVAMQSCAKNNAIVIAHCEDERLLKPGGCIHDGSKAKEFGLIGISSASEYEQVKRDIDLVRETKCQYHICHISTKESVELLRQAKKEGLPVSGEVTPHHLFLCEDDIVENHGRFKMNPPLRSKEDQEALIQGLLDGTIDCIATDQAPHSADEKNCTMDKAMMGIVTNEIAFPLVYTKLVKEKKCKLEDVMEWMSGRAADVFGVDGGEIVNFEKANITIFNLLDRQFVRPQEFESKGKSTPFEGQWLQSKCYMTICDGEVVYRKGL
ncbi:MAG: dihydroorotase [Anaerorhabdus sp.]|uniref:dihydroorotase n=1 Tax=Anaerorhabdus sp. TaxID=1872524 RepID=UPI002FCBDF0A